MMTSCFSIVAKCSIYEELLMQCDLNQCECIMTRKEFNNLKEQCCTTSASELKSL